MSLVVYRSQPEAFRHTLVQCVYVLCHTFRHVNHVSVGHRGNGNADSRYPVNLHQVACRMHITLAYVGNLSQTEITSVFRYYRKILYFLQTAETAFRLDTQPERRCLHASGIHNLVLLFEGRSNIRQCHPGLREHSRVHCHLNAPVLYTEELNPGHIFHGKQFVLDFLCLILQLTVRTAFAAQSVENSQYITEVIVDYRRPCPCRQFRLYIVHLAAELVP